MIKALAFLCAHGEFVRLEVNDHRTCYESPERNLRMHSLLPEEWCNQIERVLIQAAVENESPLTTVKVWTNQQRNVDRQLTVGASLPMTLAMALDRLRVSEANVMPLPELEEDASALLERCMAYLFSNALSWYLDVQPFCPEDAMPLDALIECNMAAPEDWIGEEPWTRDYTGPFHALIIYPDNPVGSWCFYGPSVPDLLIKGYQTLKEYRAQ
ncbi:hypothetical protein CcrC1_gp330 [Caulobacter phage C1]|nr:hypothetical protein CcrC1_gp330 [Caulobacter phage C1]UTU08559.1 hypothetical protein CcrC2_gp331 [Caulobacter phage C2]UTU09075.1 hypothetical protein CcrJ4_gp326 [Caulobacter phage J4]UTU09634.1 hypothetical protein CcrBL47_gp348 [Caulobacter phage BL47]UTU10192.1 hypothetical protein CcrRB23_gp330 [Caulobacter phage RB23]WGN97226.1 hypothetical protein [Bertelyvirus sp.]